MKRIIPTVGLLGLLSAAVLTGCGEKVREAPELAGFRMGKVIDIGDAAVLKARGLVRNGRSFRPQQALYFDHCIATPPSEEFKEVYVTLLTNNTVVSVNCIVNCAPGETPEEAKARWLKPYRDRLCPGGPYNLLLETLENLDTPTNAPASSLLIQLYTRAYATY